ncbi:A disintegrin and metalloproteinase with thrombospondin motifs 7-like [Ixodes scapularis]|uniref:A disintegrin and metalloproteinase with thrombospondin motifs 7-like n=1 Tax=Ixodes scapularis TaxID=6945 RepID=UPI001A9FD95A|nr:A disintegrin and metalloproteinase with thrombospondin motifs 7-like [Ixodes scapularis]
MLVWKVAICLLGTATGARIEEAYVYPRILEARSSDGLKVVSVDGKTTLRLEKASVLAETLLVTSYDENGQMTHTPIQAEEIEKHHYRDRDRYASLMVHDTADGLEMTGMVDAVTRIEPVLTAPRSLDGSLPHRLHTMPEEELERLKKIATPIKSPMASPLAPSWMWFDPHWREAKQEVSIISDSEHHKGMTRTEICSYVVVLMTAVNMRFDQTSYPKLQFRVVQLVTTTEKEEESFLHKHNGYIEPEVTLKKMYNFTRQYEDAYPDLFVVLTGRDLATLENGYVSQANAGMALLGGACTTYANYAIAEDRGQAYLGVHYVTHEFGHSYGCVHDGDGPVKFIPGHRGSRDPDCDPSRGFIMSYLEGGVRKFYFSRCCMQDMRNYLSNQPKSCFNNTFQYDIMKMFPNLLPASVTSVSRYCKAMFPDMIGVHHEPDLRNEVNCLVICSGNTTDGSERSFVIQAQDGMICDKGMRCIKGQCIAG